MKLKTTIKKTHCKLTSSHLIPKSLIGKSFENPFYIAIRTLFLVIASSILFSVSSYGQSNNCNAKISVEDDGNVDSASATGVVYKMIITNTGTSSDRYILSSVNINSNSQNPDDSATNSNVALNTVFLDNQNNVITELTVNSGESVSFLSKLTIPAGTPLAKWSNNKIIATSINCGSYNVNTILHTYVLNQNND